MLHDRVWRQLALEAETLCGGCMFKRATAQHIELTLADLVPCLFNVRFYWFEFFAAHESTPPQNLSQWEDALQRLSPRLRRWLRQAHATGVKHSALRNKARDSGQE
jgi:hypothetical protein